MTFRSTKTFGHDVGISAAFRQWRAQSHCHFIHGYALSIRIEYECTELDERNWCVDFGSLKPLKKKIEATFDHKLLVAADDPHLEDLKKLHDLGIADIVVVQSVGCEKFAELIYKMATNDLEDQLLTPRIKVVSVEVKEHGANGAIYLPTPKPVYDPNTRFA